MELTYYIRYIDLLSGEVGRYMKWSITTDRVDEAYNEAAHFIKQFPTINKNKRLYLAMEDLEIND
jgi:hypothetical protein